MISAGVELVPEGSASICDEHVFESPCRAVIARHVSSLMPLGLGFDCHRGVERLDDAPVDG